jgi:sugar/nucleoside kinase (ribokinase family)
LSKILVIGDLIHDVIVIPKGEIRSNTDTSAEIHKSMGGAAANVAAWLAHLGVDVSFVACVGSSEVETLEAELRQSGVSATLQTGSKQTGSLVVLVEGDTRSMLTDRGANSQLRLGAIDPQGFSIVYLSGYALLGQDPKEIISLVARAKGHEALVAIDPGSTGFIEDFGVEDFKELVSAADLVFPNQDEEKLLGLAGSVPLTVITQGELGAKAVFEDGSSIEVASERVDLADPTGAGDAFCAGFLAKLVSASEPNLTDPEAVRGCLLAGVATGSLAVSRVGARP